MIVTMRHQTDCEVAAIATAANVSWEQARDALNWRELPLGAENPVFGNPENVRAAIEKLGYKAINRTWLEVRTEAQPGKTLVLLHDPKNPLLAQHWVVLAAREGDRLGFHWGDGGPIKWLSAVRAVEMWTAGWPNAAFEVGPKIEPRGILSRIWRAIRGVFRR